LNRLRLNGSSWSRLSRSPCGSTPGTACRTPCGRCRLRDLKNGYADCQYKNRNFCFHAVIVFGFQLHLLFSNRNAISWNFVILSFDWICRAGFLSRPCNLQFSLIKVCALQF
jgi:hypothetical protein